MTFWLVVYVPGVPKLTYKCVYVLSPKFEVLRATQESAAGPAGQFVTIILQLRGQHGAPLGVQLLTPVHSITMLYK